MYRCEPIFKKKNIGKLTFKELIYYYINKKYVYVENSANKKFNYDQKILEFCYKTNVCSQDKRINTAISNLDLKTLYKIEKEYFSMNFTNQEVLGQFNFGSYKMVLTLKSNKFSTVIEELYIATEDNDLNIYPEDIFGYWCIYEAINIVEKNLEKK